MTLISVFITLVYKRSMGGAFHLTKHFRNFETGPNDILVLITLVYKHSIGGGGVSN